MPQKTKMAAVGLSQLVARFAEEFTSVCEKAERMIDEGFVCQNTSSSMKPDTLLQSQNKVFNPMFL